MNQITDRVPLSRLQILQSCKSTNSPTKRIKISNQKFPSDFFKGKIFDKKCGPSTQVVRKSSQTQQELRSNIVQRMGLSVPRRQMSTALDRKDKDDELIFGVISTAREMRRIIRKHSTEIKKNRVPKYEEHRIELPPIFSKQNEIVFL